MGVAQMSVDGRQAYGLQRMVGAHPWGVRPGRVAARPSFGREDAGTGRMPLALPKAALVARSQVVGWGHADDVADRIDDGMDTIWNGWQVCFAAALIAAAVTWLCAAPVIEVGMY